jgi:hypothetical protein
VGVAKVLELGLTVFSLAVLAALYVEVRIARRRGQTLYDGIRDAIDASSRAQMEHRDALVARTLVALREVMNATEARTIVVGPAAPDVSHEGERDTTPGDAEDEGDENGGIEGSLEPKKRREH